MSPNVAASLLAAVCVLGAARAGAQVSLRTELGARQVEVGERFVLRLKALSSGDDQPREPRLKLPAGVSAEGPSIGSQSQMSIVNGQVTQSVGISATWVLTASRAGKLQLGPASVQTRTGRQSAEVVTIDVLPAGSKPQQPPPLAGQPLDPFDLLRGMGMGRGRSLPGFPFDDEPAPDAAPAIPEEYRVDHALDPVAFLRARAVPRKVVLGEQVTLSVFAYGGRGAYQPVNVSEPSRNDFIAFSLTDGPPEHAYAIDLGGQRFIAAKVVDFALFPLKTGKLKAGAMSLGFAGRAYGNSPLGLTRKSEPIEIRVVEPPLDGRPPGYRLGDVGTYTLSAQVEPRQVEAGGSISVVAKLDGTGHLPSALLTPERNGVEWLKPQIVELETPKSGVIQGFRTFTYVVELSEPGKLDLGELTLPYYDPRARAYGVARAALGTVDVTGSSKTPTKPKAAGSAERRLTGLLKAAPRLGPGSSPSDYLTSRFGFWALLLAMPLSVALGFALTDVGRALRDRLSSRRASLATAVERALSELAVAASAQDASRTASAAEKALFLSIEKASGVRGRGLLKSELAQALAAAGIAPALAAESARLLDLCDGVRFAGDTSDLAALASAVREAALALGRLKPVKTAEPAG